MTRPAITTLDAEGLRAAALVLRDVLQATTSLTDAAAVRAMFWSAKGARDLSEEFGGSLPWWQAWCERERAAQRSAA